MVWMITCDSDTRKLMKSFVVFFHGTFVTSRRLKLANALSQLYGCGTYSSVLDGLRKFQLLHELIWKQNERSQRQKINTVSNSDAIFGNMKDSRVKLSFKKCRTY